MRSAMPSGVGHDSASALTSPRMTRRSLHASCEVPPPEDADSLVRGPLPRQEVAPEETTTQVRFGKA